ncbi:MAG: ArnT family glycosyltransferase [bacterium]
MTLDPGTAGWPALSFYVHLALQHAQYALGRLTGRYDDRLDFFVEHVDLHTLMTPARILSLVAAVGVVVVGVLLGRRLGGWFGGLLVGLVLCASPLLIELSIKVTPDILLALFSALALGCILDVYEKGRWQDYVWSAVWIGLGAASKYTPVLLVPCLVSAHLARRRPFHSRLFAAGAICAATFFAASPFTVLNLAVAQRDIASQWAHVVTGGHFGHELRGAGAVYYLVDVLPAALGWPAVVLGLFGLALAVWRRRGAWLVVLLSFACYYVGLSALRSLHAHYILPAVLPLALGLACLVAELRRAAWARGRVSVAAGVALLVVVLTPLGAKTVQDLRRYSRPSTVREAKSFVMQELRRPDVCFACELGGPDLPRDPAADLSGRPVFARLDAASRQRLLSRPWVYRYVINMYMTDSNGTDLYYDLRHYLLYDYIIVAGGPYHRYRALADQYPRQSAFYDDLARYCTLVRHFPASSDRLGPDIWIWAVGPETRRIIDDRGALARGFHADHLRWIRREDLRSFLTFTGVLATRREDWRTADLYLDTLLELMPDLRSQLLPTVAEVKYRAGDLLGAAERCAELLRERPDDPRVLALRDAILERAGDTLKDAASGLSRQTQDGR